MGAVFKRELKAYFVSPTGYILLSLYFFFTGIFFSNVYRYGVADATYVILNSVLLLIIVIPLLTMRLMSEDRRQKVDQALFTAPVSLTKIVFGKYLAAVAMFGLCNSLYIVYQIILSTYVTMNWLYFLNCLLGFMLVGSGLVALGMFVSSLTESPIISFIITAAFTIALIYLDSIAAMLGNSQLEAFAGHISFYSRFNNAALGIFDLADTLYLISFAGLFIFLTVRSLEKKRWA